MASAFGVDDLDTSMGGAPGPDPPAADVVTLIDDITGTATWPGKSVRWTTAPFET